MDTLDAPMEMLRDLLPEGYEVRKVSDGDQKPVVSENREIPYGLGFALQFVLGTGGRGRSNLLAAWHDFFSIPAQETEPARYTITYPQISRSVWLPRNVKSELSKADLHVFGTRGTELTVSASDLTRFSDDPHLKVNVRKVFKAFGEYCADPSARTRVNLNGVIFESLHRPSSIPRTPLPPHNVYPAGFGIY